MEPLSSPTSQDPGACVRTPLLVKAARGSPSHGAAAATAAGVRGDFCTAVSHVRAHFWVQPLDQCCRATGLSFLSAFRLPQTLPEEAASLGAAPGGASVGLGSAFRQGQSFHVAEEAESKRSLHVGPRSCWAAGAGEGAPVTGRAAGGGADLGGEGVVFL